MDVREAVRTAKRYVEELFCEEGLINLGLEEIEHDDRDESWNVTIGFSRPWNAPKNNVALMMNGAAAGGRSYKVVKVRDVDGQVVSLRTRDVGE